MDARSKCELARAIIDARQLRVSSFDSETWTFGLTWRRCAEEVCADRQLVPLVWHIGKSGCPEFELWARHILLIHKL